MNVRKYIFTNKILACMCVLACAELVRSTDVFSATFRMKDLLQTRQHVIDELDDYMRKEEDRLRDIKERVDQYRVEQQNSLKDEGHVMHPVNAYILIKRLTADLDHLVSKIRNKKTTESIYDSADEKDESVLYLSSADLKGAAMAIRRLQRVYKMKVEDIANGVLNGQIYSSAMTASDCFYLGSIMLESKDYLSSLDWNMEALTRLKSPGNKDDSIVEHRILEFISVNYYHLGDFESASEWAMKVLTIDPNNTRAKSNLLFYEDTITRNSNEFFENPLKSNETENNTQADNGNQNKTITKDGTSSRKSEIDSLVDLNANILKKTQTATASVAEVNNNTNLDKKENVANHGNVSPNKSVERGNENVTDSETSVFNETQRAKKSTDIIHYRKDNIMFHALCRDEFDLAPEVTAKLTCGYVNDKPFLKLAPIKVEHRYYDPDVMVFHDVISDAEIEHVKYISKPLLQRATVSGPNKTGVYSTQRISQNVFLTDSKSEIIARLSQRVSDSTGLSIVGMEPLQIANYGLGGHYITHVDFWGRTTRSEEPIQNERIATLMFYMSDVTQGGATVFPKLGLSVLPKKGSAIFWYNLHSSGEGNRATMHAACPVLDGSKWVANKWIHLKGQEFIRPCNLEYQTLDYVRELPRPVPKPEVMDQTIVIY